MGRISRRPGSAVMAHRLRARRMSANPPARVRWDRPRGRDRAGMPPQRVEVVLSARTLVTLLGLGLLVALAILSLGTLISIFVAAVIALGLDPIVGSLVRRG